MTCRHISTTMIWKAVEDGPDIAIARHCHDCSQWLSLGPSNDEPGEVQVEIRAAEMLVCSGPDIGKIDGRLLSEDEERALVACAILRDKHPSAHAIAQGMPERGAAGWLAYEITTHEAQQDERLPESRPQEQCSRCGRPESSTCCAVPPGRVPYAADQLPLPVVSEPALPPLTATEEVLEVIYASLEHVDDETRDRELARVGIRWFEIEPLADVATDARLKALEAGQIELAIAPAHDALPSRLRQARGIAVLGIGHAARKLEIPSAELEDIEQGRQEISEFDLLAFSDAYSVSLVWLTSGSGQPRSGS